MGWTKPEKPRLKRIRISHWLDLLSRWLDLFSRWLDLAKCSFFISTSVSVTILVLSLELSGLIQLSASDNIYIFVVLFILVVAIVVVVVVVVHPCCVVSIRFLHCVVVSFILWEASVHVFK